jgi:hypothetical protein
VVRPCRPGTTGRRVGDVNGHPTGTTAVRTLGLVKDFGTTRALDHLDLTIPAGEVHGFLGPNGAGKTTTIRILLGLLRRTAGEVTVLEGDPWSDSASLHRRLAYVPGEMNLWPNLTGGEVIDLLGSLRGRLVPARRTQLLEQFGLDPTKKCRTYSKGNRLGPIFGPPLGVPERVLDLSPFTHVPTVPATAASGPPLLVLTGMFVTLTALGAAALRRRSLVLPA